MVASCPPHRRSDGFSLIELLVVMTVIGLLVAIAVPSFLSQRRNANDTAARSDAERLGREITDWYVENSTTPTVVMSAGHYQIGGVDIGPASSGVQLGTHAPTPVATSSVDTTGWTATSWCVNVLQPSGSQIYFSYSSSAGLQSAVCP